MLEVTFAWKHYYAALEARPDDRVRKRLARERFKRLDRMTRFNLWVQRTLIEGPTQEDPDSRKPRGIAPPGAIGTSVR